jgi:Tfp pilus assembly protein PilN
MFVLLAGFIGLVGLASAFDLPRVLDRSASITRRSESLLDTERASLGSAHDEPPAAQQPAHRVQCSYF